MSINIKIKSSNVFTISLVSECLMTRIQKKSTPRTRTIQYVFPFPTICSFWVCRDRPSLQCYSVLSDIWVKIELCIPLESESTVLSTCIAFACLSPPSKLKFAVLFCSICKGLISFSAILF